MRFARMTTVARAAACGTRLGVRFWIASAVLLLASAAAAEIEMRRIATGFDRPVFATAPAGDTARLFIVEQHRGRILILNLADDSINATPFLTIGGLATGNEQGLLGLAFHPDYLTTGLPTSGLFYVNYTQTGGDTVIAEYAVSANPDVASTAETRLLTISQPQANHNGGWIGFGPDDDYLYIASGDGGGADDNDAGHTANIGNAQDLDSLLGKILRIDVDTDDFPADANRNYGIPATNPFAGATPGADEIWSYGLRNPYRASFDRATGELYIGDVGQDNREEIDVQPPLLAGQNYGWRLREGTIATPTPPSAPVGGMAPGAIDPIFDFAHSGGGFVGCSVTGGVVYRGPISVLQGTYFFSDFCTAQLWSLRFDGSDPGTFDGTNFTDLTNHAGDPDFTPDAGSFAAISSFGEDAAGNLYIVKLGTPSGSSILSNTGELFVLPEPAGAWLPLAALAALGWLRRPR